MKLPKIKKAKTLLLTIPLAIVLLGLFVYQYGYLEIQRKASSIADEQDMKLKILNKYIIRISEIPQLDEKITLLKDSRLLYEGELIPGETAAIASASLLEIVKGVVSGRGGVILSEQMGQLVESDNFMVVSINVQASVPDVGALSDILFSLETQSPSLFINDIDVSIRDYRNPRELLMKLQISGMTNGK